MKSKNHVIKVAVLSGGLSSEREVSLLSGKAVEESLKRLSYNVTNIDIDKNIAINLKNISPDLAFIALHGKYGEDGCIQGLLEIMGIKYTHSGVMASSIAINKPMTNNIMTLLEIDRPYGHVITLQDIITNNQIIPYPYVLKPTDDGSSINVNIINNDLEYQNFISNNIYDPAKKIIIEEYIPGQEIQTAILFDQALGTIEIKPKNKFYDYQAKYQPGFAEHIFPAIIPEYIYNKTLEQSLKIYKFLGCRSVSRVDFRYNPEQDSLKMLEINTHPGFTPLSLVPEIAWYSCGINFDTLIDLIVKDALNECDANELIIRYKNECNKTT